MFDSLDYIMDEIDYEEAEMQAFEEDMKRQFLEEALVELQKMSEEEACIYYKVDSKEEARKGIIEYWTYIA